MLQVILVDGIHGSLFCITVLFKDQLDIFFSNLILMFARSAFIVLRHSLRNLGHVYVVIINFLDFIVVLRVLLLLFDNFCGVSRTFRLVSR